MNFLYFEELIFSRIIISGIPMDYEFGMKGKGNKVRTEVNSAGMIENIREVNKKKVESEEKRKNSEFKSINLEVLISENEELEPSFIEYFSKYIINSNDFWLGDYLEEGTSQVPYCEFFKNLKSLHDKSSKSSFTHEGQNRSKTQEMKAIRRSKSHLNVRKGSSQFNYTGSEKIEYNFTFESQTNCITILLDLSPYMVIFEYETQSIPLHNMSSILNNLIRIGLNEHYKKRRSTKRRMKYYLSVFGFSTYTGEIIEIIKNEKLILESNDPEIKSNRDEILEYINSIIFKNHLVGGQKTPSYFSLASIVQKILHQEEIHTGIKSLIMISSFKNLQSSPRILFTSSWYTFAFIMTGKVFGSYYIHEKEIQQRFSFNQSFMTKYVYCSEFFQNWQKTQLIEGKIVEIKCHPEKAQKEKLILYNMDNDRKETIFDEILAFRINIQPRRKTISKPAFNDSDSVYNKHYPPKMFKQEKLLIPEEKIGDIVKTKYLQGWEQIHKDQSIDNSRFAFKLEFGYRRMVYEAKLSKNMYEATITQMFPDDLDEKSKDVNGKSMNLLEMIKIIDQIHISNFDIVEFRNSRGGANYLNFDGRSQQKLNLLQYIDESHDEWNKFFKLRLMHLEFSQKITNEIKVQFLEQMRFLFGTKISDNFFISRKEYKYEFKDKFQSREVSSYKVIFIKVTKILNFMEVKFGFLKYKDTEIKDTMASIKSRFIEKKTIGSCSVKLLHSEVYKYMKNSYTVDCMKPFQNSWKLKFGPKVFQINKHTNQLILENTSFQLLCGKRTTGHYFKSFYYYPNGVKSCKAIFLAVNHDNPNNTLEFKLSVFPEFTSLKGYRKTKDKQFSFGIGKMHKASIFGESFHEEATVLFPFIFNFLLKDLKKSQVNYLQVLQSYSEIHETLLKKRIEVKESGIEEKKLKKQICITYKFSNHRFEADYLKEVTETHQKYYSEAEEKRKMSYLSRFQSVLHRKNPKKNQSMEVPLEEMLPMINIDQIPEPTKPLMNSQILEIRGDFTSRSQIRPDKKYTFFLLAPFRPIYLWKKPNNPTIYYRSIPPIYHHVSLEDEVTESIFEDCFKAELVKKVERQEQEQQYYLYYMLVSSGRAPPEMPKIEESLLNARFSEPILTKGHSNNKLLNFSNFSSFSLEKDLTTVNIYENPKQIIEAIRKQESKLKFSIKKQFDITSICKILNDGRNLQVDVENRFRYGLSKFKDVFFATIQQYFIKSEGKMVKKNTDLNKFTELSFGTSEIMHSSFTSESNSNVDKTIDESAKEKEDPKANEKSGEKKAKEMEYATSILKSYYFEKEDILKNQSFDSKENYMVLKLSTEDDEPLNEENFLKILSGNLRKLMTDSNSNSNSNSNSTSTSNPNPNSSTNPNPKLRLIKITFFGHNIFKNCEVGSQKIELVINPLEKLINECFAYVSMAKITDVSQIVSVEAALENVFLIKSSNMKIPDEIANSQEDMMHQLNAGEMKDIIPFENLQNFPKNKFLAVWKSQQGLNIKYWISLQILPTRMFRIKRIDFNLININEDFLRQQTNFQIGLNKLIDQFMAKLKRLIKIRSILRQVEKTLRWPIDTEIILFIKEEHLEKLMEEAEKKAVRNIRIPKKFQSRRGGMIGIVNTETREVTQPKVLIQNNGCKVPFITYGYIPFSSKFAEGEMLSLIMNSEKMSPNYIRNLENIYILFHNKEHLILELEEIYILNGKETNQKVEKTEGGRQSLDESQLREKLARENLKSDTASQTSQSFGQFDQSDKPERYLKYTIYCVNRSMDKKSVIFGPGTLLKKTVEEVTFNKIGVILEKNPNSLDTQLIEYFRNGEKYSMSFTIPHISEKFNLRQYLKQYLESQFSHKPTEIKQMPEQDTRKESFRKVEDIMASNFYPVGNVRRSNIFPTYHEEENKCKPVLWLFNTTYQGSRLSDVVGSCYYLVQMTIEDKYDYVGNARIWKRSFDRKKNKFYVYGSDEANSIENSLLQYLSKQQYESQMSLSGQVDPESVVNETYIKINILSYFGYPRFQIIENIYKQFIFSSVYDYYFENKLFNVMYNNYKSNSQKNIDSEKNLKLQVQSPKKSHKSFRARFLTDTEDHKLTKKVGDENKIEEEEENLQIPLPPDHPKRSESSPQKMHVFHFSYNDIYKSLMKVFQSMESELCEKKSECSHVYKSANELYIQEPFEFIKILLIKIVELFQEIRENLFLPCVIYCIAQKETYFRQLQFNQQNFENGILKSLSDFEKDLKSIESEQNKIGFFFLDTLPEIQQLNETTLMKEEFLLRQNKGRKQSECEEFSFSTNLSDDPKLNTEFDEVKQYKQSKSFCQNKYLFRRSLAFHFEIGVNSFQLFGYNFLFKTPKFDQMKAFLIEVEYWFSEKLRLLTFLEKVRKILGQVKSCDPSLLLPKASNFIVEKNNCIDELKEKIQTKKENLSKLKKLQLSASKSLSQEPLSQQIIISKLIRSLVFDKLPNEEFTKNKKYINKMYEILVTKPIPYATFPEYKGNEKSRLEKLGKEYLCLLHHQYDKPRRKESNMHFDDV